MRRVVLSFHALYLECDLQTDEMRSGARREPAPPEVENYYLNSEFLKRMPILAHGPPIRGHGGRVISWPRDAISLVSAR